MFTDKLPPVFARDFGLSRFKDTSATMTAVGTPLYVAPEVWKRMQYDESVDMCVGRHACFCV